MFGWVRHWAQHRPNHTAIVTDDETISYAELEVRVERMAVGLHRLGLSPGDRLAFCGLNRVELLEAFLACSAVGTILVPLNNRLTASELHDQLDDGDVRRALVTDGFGPTMAEAASAGGLEIVDLDDEADRRHLLGTGSGPSDWRPAEAGSVGVAHGAKAQPVLMVYTSGTTGRPKGAVHTAGSLLFAVLNAVAHQDLSAEDRVLTVLPLFHVGGLNIQTVPALYAGATVVLARRFDVDSFCDLIERHQPTQTLLVPAVMTALLASPRFEAVDLSCLRGINSGSSVVPPALIEPFHARGVPVGQVYGSTETGPTAVVLRYDDAFDHVGSCGRPALHNEVRLVDEANRDVEHGSAGELLLRGPNLFDHYHRRPEATAEAFLDGWYRTGDIARRDDGGWLHIEDRLDDLIISGGENVYPAECEQVLAQHPSIEAVAIVGRPDQRWGEVPVAYVEVSGGAGPPTIDELRAWCQGRLARFKQPRDVIAVESLPRTALGKVTKHLLRESQQ